jgi:hypothetical protein
MRAFCLLLAGATSVVACSSASSPGVGDSGFDGGGGPDVSVSEGGLGAPCDYVCGGGACDMQCDGNRVLQCSALGVWTLAEDCTPEGKTCAFELVDGGPAALYACIAGPADAASTDAAPLQGDASGPAATCEASGGTVTTSPCCTSANDFPDTCQIGACGCSPSNSHTVQTCTCPAGKCFDGAECR